jgi:hemolysin activation/secretion protein
LGSATIASYSNFYGGASYGLTEPIDDNLFLNRYHLELEALFGSRSTDLETVSQSQFLLSASYLWSIDAKNHFFFGNQSAWLNSSDYLQNELYRIGGIYNLRGVNEESLFASGYSIVNLEYRFKPSGNSYFYTISDFAWVENRVEENSFNVISFGLGYAFRTRAGILNLSYANGTFENTPFSFENSKVHVKILSYF